MNSLDDLSIVKKYDSANAFDSIKQLPDQCKQAWEQSSLIDFPSKYSKATNIVISGMGGSSYGARIVKSLYSWQTLKVPIDLSNNYELPQYINEKSLVILSSYSGSTEETLTAASVAKEKQTLISGITSGGKLGEFLKSNNFPSYIFNPVHNPSSQPRIGVGYMLFGLIGMLAKLGFIIVNHKDIENLINFLKEKKTELSGNPLNKNLAKQLALKIAPKIPIFIVADFLEGTAYAIRNPMHETGKQFALYFAVPEINHHLMEGLSYPSEIKKYLLFIFIKTELYDSRNSKRLELTKEVVEKNSIETDTITLSGNSQLTQTIELIQLGNWVSFYLAMLNGVDPSKIPWVDYFKKKLNRDPNI